jgi:hypothetical protein
MYPTEESQQEVAVSKRAIRAICVAREASLKWRPSALQYVPIAHGLARLDLVLDRDLLHAHALMIRLIEAESFGEDTHP